MRNEAFVNVKLFAFSLFLAILLSQCSESPKKAAVTGTGNKPMVADTSTKAAATKNVNETLVHTVLISDMKFQPEQIEVSKGDTVIWKNNDMVAHDVTQSPDKKWSSAAIPSGGSWKYVVTESSDYYCSIHPVMKGKLVVK